MRDDKEYNLFCVGDDWQSIYRFAGSDIGYILNFENYWGISEKSKIETTYRFKGSLIDVSSSFIMKNPMQIKKSIVSKETDNSFALKLVEADSYNKSVQALNSELLSLPQNASVFIIGRYSFDINVLKEIRNGKIINKYRPEYKVRYDNENQRINISYVDRPDLNIQFITAHRSKGLQADYIFIINNKNDRLGFPSKIQDAPILNLLLDNCDTFEHAEERRLYYVAMTRAKEKTVMIAPPTHKQSVFIGELKREYGEAFTQYKTCPLCGGKLIMRSGPYGNFYGCENYKNKDCRYKEKIN